MIELTEQQMQALENGEDTPPQVVNTRTKETFVMLRTAEYKRLKEEEYDDSPWTSEERHALAWEAGKHAGWEEMDEYDEDGLIEPGRSFPVCSPDRAYAAAAALLQALEDDSARTRD